MIYSIIALYGYYIGKMGFVTLLCCTCRRWHTMARIEQYNNSVGGWPEGLAFSYWEAHQNESKTVL